MKYAFSLVLIACFAFACTTSPVTPSRNSRQAIDSIFQRKIVFLQPEMDSLCALRHEQLFKITVDSMLSSRQLEMDSLVH